VFDVPKSDEYYLKTERDEKNRAGYSEWPHRTSFLKV
jgi:hypothetical protein